MTQINLADAIILGSNAADAVFAGATQVWPPSTGTVSWVSSNGFETGGYYGALDFGFGTPAPVAGDLLLARAYSPYNAMQMSAAGGQTWTALPDAGATYGQMWWAIFNGTLSYFEYTDPSYQGSHGWFGDLTAYHGNHPTAPIDVVAVDGGAVGAFASITLPPITTIHNNVTRAAFIGMSYGNNNMDGVPLTQRYYSYGTVGFVALTDYLGDSIQATAGTTAAMTVGATHATNWCCTHIGIRPA